MEEIIHRLDLLAINIYHVANILEGERVQIVNVNNGERLETYTIAGERGSGMICLNGAAARKAAKGDIIIIISFAQMEFNEAKNFTPYLVFPDQNNKAILE